MESFPAGRCRWNHCRSPRIFGDGSTESRPCPGPGSPPKSPTSPGTLHLLIPADHRCPPPAGNGAPLPHASPAAGPLVVQSCHRRPGAEARISREPPRRTTRCHRADEGMRIQEPFGGTGGSHRFPRGGAQPPAVTRRLWPAEQSDARFGRDADTTARQPSGARPGADTVVTRSSRSGFTALAHRIRFRQRTHVQQQTPLDQGLSCPVCRLELALQLQPGRPARLVCESGHGFDAAKQGYFNLLDGQGNQLHRRRGPDGRCPRLLPGRRTLRVAGRGPGPPGTRRPALGGSAPHP